LSVTTRIKKRIHFLICCWCQRYEEHLHYMSKTALQFRERGKETSNIPFPPDAKERIKQRLADQIW